MELMLVYRVKASVWAKNRMCLGLAYRVRAIVRC